MHVMIDIETLGLGSSILMIPLVFLLSKLALFPKEAQLSSGASRNMIRQNWRLVRFVRHGYSG